MNHGLDGSENFLFQIDRVALTFAAMQLLAEIEIRRMVRAALAEDVGSGDVTTLATVPKKVQATARMVARESLVVCGVAVAEMVFRQVSRGLTVKQIASDGKRLKKGEPILVISGEARAILTAERVALNFVQRLSGIATLTAQFVAAVKGTGAKILDTRKTTPGLRLLEKYAVACGGGQNHRISSMVRQAPLLFQPSNIWEIGKCRKIAGRHRRLGSNFSQLDGAMDWSESKRVLRARSATSGRPSALRQSNGARGLDCQPGILGWRGWCRCPTRAGLP